MELHTLFPKISLVSLFLPLLLLLQNSYYSNNIIVSVSASDSDVDVNPLEFALNLEFLEAEFFLNGALGHGLDTFSPELAQGGPYPVGAKIAKLDPLTRDVIYQFALQEVGHLKYFSNSFLIFTFWQKYHFGPKFCINC